MPPQLGRNELRVLGVLIEKSLTTPEQYPLTLNALVNGCNQKSCRDPMMSLDEEKVFDSLDTLREHHLVAVVRTSGGRTDRYRHRVADTWSLEGRKVAILAELILRGPQTDGELRQRASRMVQIPSLDDLAAAIDGLADHEGECFIRRLGPPGRRRGTKYAHTLYPPGQEPKVEEDDGDDEELEDVPPARAAAAARESSAASTALTEELSELRDRVAGLEERLADLESTVERLLG